VLSSGGELGYDFKRKRILKKIRGRKSGQAMAATALLCTSLLNSAQGFVNGRKKM